MTKYNRLHRAVRRLNDYEVLNAKRGSGRSAWPALHQRADLEARIRMIVGREPRSKPTPRSGAQ